jgi:hypothetical protein
VKPFVQSPKISSPIILSVRQASEYGIFSSPVKLDLLGVSDSHASEIHRRVNCLSESCPLVVVKSCFPMDEKLQRRSLLPMLFPVGPCMFVVVLIGLDSQLEKISSCVARQIILSLFG